MSDELCITDFSIFFGGSDRLLLSDAETYAMGLPACGKLSFLCLVWIVDVVVFRYNNGDGFFYCTGHRG